MNYTNPLDIEMEQSLFLLDRVAELESNNSIYDFMKINSSLLAELVNQLQNERNNTLQKFVTAMNKFGKSGYLKLFPSNMCLSHL